MAAAAEATFCEQEENGPQSLELKTDAEPPSQKSPPDLNVKSPPDSDAKPPADSDVKSPPDCEAKPAPDSDVKSPPHSIVKSPSDSSLISSQDSNSKSIQDSFSKTPSTTFDMTDMNQLFQEMSFNHPIGNFKIQAQNFQFGNSCSMYVNSDKTIQTPNSQREEKNKTQYKPYFDCKKLILQNDIQKIAKNIGENWKFVARYLGLQDSEIENIKYDNRLESLQEINYQMLKYWIQKNPETCTVQKLAEAFWENHNFEAILELPLEK